MGGELRLALDTADSASSPVMARVGIITSPLTEKETEANGGE